jgi:hypothetical protein
VSAPGRKPNPPRPDSGATATLIAKRKAADDAVHLEARRGGRPGKAGGREAKVANLASFVADSSGKTGKR